MKLLIFLIVFNIGNLLANAELVKKAIESKKLDMIKEADLKELSKDERKEIIELCMQCIDNIQHLENFNISLKNAGAVIRLISGSIGFCFSALLISSAYKGDVFKNWQEEIVNLILLFSQPICSFFVFKDGLKALFSDWVYLKNLKDLVKKLNALSI